MQTLSEVLIAKGEEYAPFDVARAGRIYEAIAPIFDFKECFETQCTIIHILGTNGKGSTGRFITMGLEQQGKSVLHFSSPHIFDFTERYYISQADFKGEIPYARLEAAHRALWACEAVREASYFEYATFLALVLGREYEYLVLESGVGGEFDSTSVVMAHLSVFTLIGLDHQEMLGNSLEEIALTKLRAMGQYAILAKQSYAEVERIAMEVANTKGAMCALWECMDNSVCFQQEREAFKHYVHRHQLPAFLCENLYTALRALAFFGMKFDFATLGRLSLRGRCELLRDNIVLDVGHNIDGARALRAFFGKKKVNLVYNAYVQKDIEAILCELLPIIKKVLIISVENPRVCPKQRICEALEALEITFMDFDMASMSEDEMYLVFGSFSVVQEFLRQYKEVQCRIN